MTTEKRGCLTCAFADCLRTPTGKLKKGVPIKCLAPAPSPSEIVSAVRGIVPDAMLVRFLEMKPYPQAMWPQDGDTGETCSQWKGGAK